MGSPITDEDLQPAWEPNRRPVNFDYDLAAEAIEQCRAVARQLRELRARRIVRGDSVIEHWTGQYFLDWEPPHKTARKDELEMAEHLESLAGRIAGWAEAAREEEKFRRGQVDRWNAELEENRRNRPRGVRLGS